MAHAAGTLENASPSDQEFIDMIVPYQGAIRIARIELERGQDAELKERATAIIDAQRAEVEELRSRGPRGGASPPQSDERPKGGLCALSSWGFAIGGV